MKISTDKLFELKQKFLSNIPHPKLIKKAIKELEKEVKEPHSFQMIQLDSSKTLAYNCELYTAHLLKLKLTIANSQTALELFSSLHSLHHFQISLIDELSKYLPENCDYNDEGIKQSDPFDVYAYSKELAAEGINENEIKAYLCTQFEKADVDGYSALAKGVIRANKIKSNG